MARSSIFPYPQIVGLIRSAADESEYPSVSDTNPRGGLVGGLILGGEEFVAAMRARLSNADDLREVPRRERLAGRPNLAELLEGADKARKARDKAIGAAHILYGYTMKEIGDHLGVHYATVSRAVRRQEREDV